jgi:hypothetical protein
MTVNRTHLNGQHDHVLIMLRVCNPTNTKDRPFKITNMRSKNRSLYELSFCTSRPDRQKLPPLLVRFQVPTATSTKMTVLWDVMPCNLVEDRRLAGTLSPSSGHSYLIIQNGQTPQLKVRNVVRIESI